ncbi:pyridoxal phosphate-dependent decarboxylase family protein [Scytonema sp. PRP1]|uniref:pyridoxal phosphate-dependent decarboxylase family protein n=1 Tax=Scytonema sp. PRP1 TaxID=3120513 RepID=UPI002FD1034C
MVTKMNKNLEIDKYNFKEILNEVLNEASNFLQGIDARPVEMLPPHSEVAALPLKGIGANKALEIFKQKYLAGITGSSGSRYFGFVTGGATPASVAGDWLVSVFDQNAIRADDSCAGYIERETISFLQQLFKLSEAHTGTFVSGATMSNFVGLAIARQWIARQLGVNIAQDGLYALPAIKILSATPHSCIFKALSMLGMGKSHLQIVQSLPDREAIDINSLKKSLATQQNTPCIVVANAGTVNTVDFDDLATIAQLKEEFNFWFHVDAAFGGFAACSPKYEHFTKGIDAADSIAIDAHKWLNVPYDCAMQFTRHRELQIEVFQNSASYLGIPTSSPDFIDLTPENSRRLRALPAWFSIMAYGAEGYREIVERNCELAQIMGQRINNSSHFRLLAPVSLNVVCFTLSEQKYNLSLDNIQKFLAKLTDKGEVFLTPTVYNGTPAMRAAIANWRTQEADIEIAWKSLSQTVSAFSV